MADESKSRYSIAEQLRVFAGRQAFDEERELVYRAAETIDNLAKAYVAERDALLAIRSELGPRWKKVDREVIDRGEHVFVKGGNYWKRGMYCTDAKNQCWVIDAPALPDERPDGGGNG